MEPTMMEHSEKILNGKKMDQEFPLLLILFTLDFLDTIFTIPKLIVIWLSSELLLFTILLLLKEVPLLVSVLLMMKMTDGNFAPLMMNLPLIGFALFPQFSDFPAPKKKTQFLKKSFMKFNP